MPATSHGPQRARVPVGLCPRWLASPFDRAWQGLTIVTAASFAVTVVKLGPVTLLKRKKLSAIPGTSDIARRSDSEREREHDDYMGDAWVSLDRQSEMGLVEPSVNGG